MPLDLVEMGLPESLTARVLAVEPCPPIARGPGRVVLSTVNHLNRYLFDLAFVSPTGQLESVRTTGYHKFYRQQDQAWVSAVDLQQGDTLQGAHGPLTVASLTRVPGAHRVYNLTVEGEHVYRVSTLGALVHNNGCDPKEIFIDRNRAPQSAELLEDAGAVDRPLTVNRNNVASRRRAATKDLETRQGFDRDEAPPAVLRSDGDDVLVRHVPSSDNRSAGGQIGRQLGDAAEVIIRIIDGGN